MRSFAQMHNDYLDPDRYYGNSDYCMLCGNNLDDCTCPECPECGEYGNPECYVEHSLRHECYVCRNPIEKSADVTVAYNVDSVDVHMCRACFNKAKLTTKLLPTNKG